MSPRLPLLLLLALAAAGCAQREEPPPLPGPLDGDSRPGTAAALARMEAVERRMDEIQLLPPERRLAAQRDLGRELERAVEAAADTRLENKALFLLAHWRFNFAPGGAGTDQALDRLESCRSPALKHAGRALRVQVLLRQGRLVQAREQARALAAEVPEWDSMLALVDLYERVGRPAPPTAGRDADGREVEALAATDGAWRVVLLGAVLDENAAFQLRRYLDAAARAKAPVRVVGLAADSSARLVAAQAAGLPGALLLWSDSAERSEGWRRDWAQPPGSAVVALVDPRGRIAAVQFGPEELPALVAP